MARVAAAEAAGRGRHLLAVEGIGAGEVVLAEAPICWWVDARVRGGVCARCIAPFAKTGGICCGECGEAHWCSSACKEEDADRHSGFCRHLRSAAQLRPQDAALEVSDEVAEALTLAECVAHVAALRSGSPAAFEQFWQLHSEGVELSQQERTSCERIAALLRTAGGETPWLDEAFVKGCCQRDKANGLAITMPVSAATGPSAAPAQQAVYVDPTSVGADAAATERLPRAYAVYPTIALANHSCLPTVARFDELEAAKPIGASARLENLPAPACAGALQREVTAAEAGDAEAAGRLCRPPCSLAARLVALHHVPAGSEVLLCYTPLGVPEPQRRQRLQAEYGFDCDCRRCALERAEQEEESASAQAEEAGAEPHVVEGAAAATGGDDAIDLTYVALFCLKHICHVCMGTMAPYALPIPAQDSPCVCNRCGIVRTEAEFEARVELHFAEAASEEEEDWEVAGSDEAVDRIAGADPKRQRTT